MTYFHMRIRYIILNQIKHIYVLKNSSVIDGENHSKSFPLFLKLSVVTPPRNSTPGSLNPNSWLCNHCPVFTEAHFIEWGRYVTRSKNLNGEEQALKISRAKCGREWRICAKALGHESAWCVGGCGRLMLWSLRGPKTGTRNTNGRVQMPFQDILRKARPDLKKTVKDVCMVVKWRTSRKGYIILQTWLDNLGLGEGVFTEASPIRPSYSVAPQALRLASSGHQPGLSVCLPPCLPSVRSTAPWS